MFEALISILFIETGIPIENTLISISLGMEKSLKCIDKKDFFLNI